MMLLIGSQVVIQMVPLPSFRYLGDHVMIPVCVLIVQQFGEAFRPCQLSRFVYGFPRGKNQNEFLFAQSLNYKLFPLLQRHSANKPMLIFVSTRKGNSLVLVDRTLNIQ